MRVCAGARVSSIDRANPLTNEKTSVSQCVAKNGIQFDMPITCPFEWEVQMTVVN